LALACRSGDVGSPGPGSGPTFPPGLGKPARSRKRTVDEYNRVIRLAEADQGLKERVVAAAQAAR
jgi:hypothetical protein